MIHPNQTRWGFVGPNRMRVEQQPARRRTLLAQPFRTRTAMPPTPAPGSEGLKILAFDIFGTVVDWHTCVAREVRALCPGTNGDAFALAWRDGYQPAMQRVRSGELGWTLIDDLHRMVLEDTLRQFGITHLSPAQINTLNRVWHRLDPWPDTIEGLTRLKAKFTLCSLSNGNLGLARIFGVQPSEVLMVAAHQDDLDGARACGLRTAYIERPHEFGPTRAKDVSDNGRSNWHAKDLRELARALGA